jgi:hypothetical protein
LLRVARLASQVLLFVISSIVSIAFVASLASSVAWQTAGTLPSDAQVWLITKQIHPMCTGKLLDRFDRISGDWQNEYDPLNSRTYDWGYDDWSMGFVQLELTSPCYRGGSGDSFVAPDQWEHVGTHDSSKAWRIPEYHIIFSLDDPRNFETPGGAMIFRDFPPSYWLIVAWGALLAMLASAAASFSPRRVDRQIDGGLTAALRWILIGALLALSVNPVQALAISDVYWNLAEQRAGISSASLWATWLAWPLRPFSIFGGVMYGAVLAGLIVTNTRDWIAQSISWFRDDAV